MKRSKQYVEMAKQVDRVKMYSPKEALSLLKGFSTRKFDESVEVHFNLGIDPRQADQQLRGTLDLPKGTGRKVRVAAVVSPSRVDEALSAGADHAGSEDLIEKMQGGWLDFDLLIATPDMMGKLGKLGRVLGSKGLMPNPKSGTVVQDVKTAVIAFKAGKVEYRNDKNGIIHLPIGKVSFSVDDLAQNFVSIFDALTKVKPSKAKGVYMKSVVVCSTMGPGIQIESQKLRWRDDS